MVDAKVLMPKLLNNLTKELERVPDDCVYAPLAKDAAEWMKNCDRREGRERSRSRSPVVLRENPQSVFNRFSHELAAKQLLCDIKQDIIEGMTKAAKDQHERIEDLEALVKDKDSRIATLESELAASKALYDIKQSVIDDVLRLVHVANQTRSFTQM